MLLDEPTANLDVKNEAEILATLFGLMKGRTCLLITHRLVGLDRADRILVMEAGRIVEQGSERELLALQGSYFRLWQNQNRFLLDRQLAALERKCYNRRNLPSSLHATLKKRGL